MNFPRSAARKTPLTMMRRDAKVRNQKSQKTARKTSTNATTNSASRDQDTAMVKPNAKMVLMRSFHSAAPETSQSTTSRLASARRMISQEDAPRKNSLVITVNASRRVSSVTAPLTVAMVLMRTEKLVALLPRSSEFRPDA